jgi:hypothetical protein
LLRTVRALRTTPPSWGRYELGADDLKAAHPTLRSALEAFARRFPGAGVHASHLKNGCTIHRKVSFTFESGVLQHLLSSAVL